MNFLKICSVVTLVIFSLSAHAAQEGSCVDVPGFDFCSLDAVDIYSLMSVQQETFDDPMMGGHDYKIDWRAGTFGIEDESVTCLKGTALRSTLRDFTSCRFNNSIARGNDAVKVFQWMDDHPKSEMIGEDDRILTYSLRDRKTPNGSRIIADRKLGIYSCYVRMDFDDLNFTQLNLPHSDGYCSVKIVKYH